MVVVSSAIGFSHLLGHSYGSFVVWWMDLDGRVDRSTEHALRYVVLHGWMCSTTRCVPSVFLYFVGPYPLGQSGDRTRDGHICVCHENNNVHFVVFHGITGCMYIVPSLRTSIQGDAFHEWIYLRKYVGCDAEKGHFSNS